MEEINKQVIEKELRKTVDKAQKEFKSDILRFGSALNKKYPGKWNEIKDKWSDLFPKVEYTVNANVTLRTTQLKQGPTYPPEEELSVFPSLCQNLYNIQHDVIQQNECEDYRIQ
ncbi:Ger(x)C family spore germination C-terminal domain-containing protein [Effusibacillus consociatus]|uniref:Ger(X)C family spore germination C-terminal domain-containing protein n=1 Tax=Effusibacillus consociatus TaxID=1117041 RepID=A0ABV9Q404_9BACL